MYPNIFRRYLATLTDLAVVVFIIWGTIQVADNFGFRDNLSANVLIILTFLLYEPVFTSKAVTLGQYIFRFRIREEEGYKNITLIKAYLRFFTKIILGGWSLLKIPGDRRRQAIHDSVAGSLVLNQRHLSSTQAPINV